VTSTAKAKFAGALAAVALGFQPGGFAQGRLSLRAAGKPHSTSGKDA